MDNTVLCFVLIIVSLIWILRLRKQHKESEAQYKSNIDALKIEKAKILQDLKDTLGVNRDLIEVSLAKAEETVKSQEGRIYELNIDVQLLKSTRKADKEKFRNKLSKLTKYKIYRAMKKNEDFSIPNEIFLIATNHNDAVYVIKNQIFKNSDFITVDMISSFYEITLVNRDKSRILMVDYDIM